MDFWSNPASRVGALALVVAILVGAMTLRVNEDTSFFWGRKKHWFLVDDASGLIKKSAVRTAGIKIGIIREIRLQEGHARIDLSLDPEVELREGSRVEIRTTGILGDKYIEIKNGDSSNPLLAEGGQILLVDSQGSLDAIMKEVGTLSKSLSQVADGLKEATLVGGNQSTPLGRIIHNIDVVTGDLREITQSNKQKFGHIIDRVDRISSTLDEVVNDDSENGFRVAWSKAMAGISRLDRTMANIEDISEKVNTGKGTIGRLINDEKTVEELNTALTSVSRMVGGVNKISTSLDFRSEYLSEQNLYKSYLGVRIRPGLDRYYEIQVVDDPKGVVERVDTKTTYNPNDPSSSTSSQSETKTFKNKVKYTALFAKNFWDFTVRAGLIESTGGAGLDYHLFHRKARLSVDAFDFGDTGSHVRAYARYDYVRGLYVIGGADDFARKGNYSTYVGAGIDLTNDDLKLLFSRINF